MFYPVKGAFLFAGWIVTTGIFKEAVDEHPCYESSISTKIEQDDLSVHGGEDKAIYTYPKNDQEYRNHRSEYYEL